MRFAATTPKSARHLPKKVEPFSATHRSKSVNRINRVQQILKTGEKHKSAKPTKGMEQK
jgi:hypothetical protein